MRWLVNNILRSRVWPRQPRLGARPLSTIASDFYEAQRISVPVGSSGSVKIDLHNLSKISSSAPLLVYFPPSSTEAPASDLAKLPRFTHRHATAVIHYRWTEPFKDEPAVDGDILDGEETVYRRFHPGWPAPIHDTLTAYAWIVENLAPTTSRNARRDIYVYGSYAGASLATSLALTESHPHERMAVRGCVAYNGIYNWTMFLPDHPINKLPTSQPQHFLEDILALPSDPDFIEMKHSVGQLFNKPDDLFDAFASSCLFFQTPGLHVPPSFDESALASSSALVDMPWLTEEEAEQPMPTSQPRRSHLVFPPRKSTLKLPEMLLLHGTAPPLPPSMLRGRQGDTEQNPVNSFQTQAEALAKLMRRSINMVELKDRMKWDDDMDDCDGEAERRVRVHDIGAEGGDVTAAWFEERMLRRSMD
ncbi:hypothetical protein F4808DRAFT_413933 [Astrocystis sublimbata]|nr:hypothetical protein F4808DRAFT_413933 [Astrocystis sublimbata]